MLSADISRQMKIILNLAMREVPYSSSPPLRTLPVPGAASEFFWLVLPLVSASDVKFSKAAMTNSVFFSFGRRSGCSCPAAGLQQGLCLKSWPAGTQRVWPAREEPLVPQGCWRPLQALPALNPWANHWSQELVRIVSITRLIKALAERIRTCPSCPSENTSDVPPANLGLWLSKGKLFCCVMRTIQTRILWGRNFLRQLCFKILFELLSLHLNKQSRPLIVASSAPNRVKEITAASAAPGIGR